MHDVLVDRQGKSVDLRSGHGAGPDFGSKATWRCPRVSLSEIYDLLACDISSAQFQFAAGCNTGETASHVSFSSCVWVLSRGCDIGEVCGVSVAWAAGGPQ